MVNAEGGIVFCVMGKFCGDRAPLEMFNVCRENCVVTKCVIKGLVEWRKGQDRKEIKY